MSQLLTTVRKQVVSAAGIAAHEGSAYYKKALENNKQYIVDGGNPEKVGELSKQLFFTTLASIEKRYAHAKQEWEAVKRGWNNRGDLLVAEAGIAALFTAECYAWFCVGEIVGRGGTLTGYKP